MPRPPSVVVVFNYDNLYNGSATHFSTMWRKGSWLWQVIRTLGACWPLVEACEDTGAQLVNRVWHWVCVGMQCATMSDDIDIATSMSFRLLIETAAADQVENITAVAATLAANLTQARETLGLWNAVRYGPTPPFASITYETVPSHERNFRPNPPPPSSLSPSLPSSLPSTSPSPSPPPALPASPPPPPPLLPPAGGMRISQIVGVALPVGLLLGVVAAAVAAALCRGKQDLPREVELRP